MSVFKQTIGFLSCYPLIYHVYSNYLNACNSILKPFLTKHYGHCIFQQFIKKT